MDIMFQVTTSSPSSYKLANTVYLREDTWDDFGFSVTFRAYFCNTKKEVSELGRVKIGRAGLEDDQSLNLPAEPFNKLTDVFFSLGETPEYYEELNKLGEDNRKKILIGLKDIAFNLDLKKKFSKEKVLNVALQRGFSNREIEQQLHRLSHGGVRLKPYRFQYRLSGVGKNCFDFCVAPYSNPPTNIHVLIGRNGVGKTTILKNLVTDFLKGSPKLAYEGIEQEHSFGLNARSQQFATVAFVSFSAFDDFDLEETESFKYIGLKKGKKGGRENKSIEDLTNEFMSNMSRCRDLSRANRWQDILSKLNTDPIFKDNEIVKKIYAYLTESDNDVESCSKINDLFGKKLSSGHKIVLLTLSALVNIVEENSLILFDEPEAHLHPPLLSAFVRAVSELMINRNAVAIMATHSPVVLQEIPRSCVSVLSRLGEVQKIERPQIETFGENVGTLTREIFRLEVDQSGFFQLIKEVAKDSSNVDDLFSTFGHQLGSEAKLLAMAEFLVSKKGK